MNALACALGSAMALAVAPQEPVPVLVAFPLHERVPSCETGKRLLEGLLEARFVRDGEVAERVVLGATERTLAALARRGALRPCPGLGAELPAHCRGPDELYALPFSSAVVLGYDAARLRAEEVPDTWEELAQRPDLRDRVGLPDPELDAAPWLAAMAHRLARGDDERSGHALWTSLDAQAGTYFTDYEAMIAALRTGRIAVALAPAAIFHLFRGEREVPLFAVKPLREHVPVARYGVAVGARVPVDGDRVALALRQHGHTGMHRVRPEDAGVATDWDVAERRLAHFEAKVRGTGRGVEKVADALDLAFTAAFLVFLVFAWRKLSRKEAREPAPPA